MTQPMTIPKLICIIATLAAASGLIAAQSREEGVRVIQSRLLDAPSATYKLEASRNGRGYQFCNASAFRVVRFRIGCVETTSVQYKILTQRPFENDELAAADVSSLSCRFWTSNHGFFPGEACKKGKLAVTEVALADGSIWKLKSLITQLPAGRKRTECGTSSSPLGQVKYVISEN